MDSFFGDDASGCVEKTLRGGGGRGGDVQILEALELGAKGESMTVLHVAIPNAAIFSSHSAS
jgi:hypothetical protein